MSVTTVCCSRDHMLSREPLLPEGIECEIMVGGGSVYMLSNLLFVCTEISPHQPFTLNGFTKLYRCSLAFP